MPMARVLVIGAGATGSCVSLQLRRVMGRDVTIEVWEKARGPGGRMSTNRQEVNGTSLRADMGAQYLSMDGADSACAEVADLLVKEGVCADVPASVLSGTPERPSGKSWRHLAGTNGGVNDALKLLLEQAGVQAHYEKRLAALDEHQGGWRARPFDGAPGIFDAVVLAVPGCGVGGDNLNKIRGGWENLISAEQNRQLLDVQHDHRWSFALFLPLECAAKCDAFFGPDAVEKTVDDATLHLLCYQSRKTAQLSGAGSTEGIVVVAHTTLAWAKKNARASGRDERLLREVSERVAGTIGLGGAISNMLLGSKVITWKQSQVTKPAASTTVGGPCMLLSVNPPLLLAGDYFTESNFGGCLKSGFAGADLLAKLLKGEGAEVAAICSREDTGKATKRKGEGTKGKGGFGGKGKNCEGGKGYGGKGKGRYHKEAGDWDGNSWAWGESSGKGGKKGYAWKQYTGA